MKATVRSKQTIDAKRSMFKIVVTGDDGGLWEWWLRLGVETSEEEACALGIARAEEEIASAAREAKEAAISREEIDKFVGDLKTAGLIKSETWEAAKVETLSAATAGASG